MTAEQLVLNTRYGAAGVAFFFAAGTTFFGDSTMINWRPSIFGHCSTTA